MGCCGSSCRSDVDDWVSPKHVVSTAPNAIDKRELLNGNQQPASPSASSTRSWAVASEMADLRCMSPEGDSPLAQSKGMVGGVVEGPPTTAVVQEVVVHEEPIASAIAIKDCRSLTQTDEQVTVGSEWCTSFGTAEQTSVIECSCSDTTSCSSHISFQASCPSPTSTATSSWDEVPEE